MVSLHLTKNAVKKFFFYYLKFDTERSKKGDRKFTFCTVSIRFLFLFFHLYLWPHEFRFFSSCFFLVYFFEVWWSTHCDHFMGWSDGQISFSHHCGASKTMVRMTYERWFTRVNLKNWETQKNIIKAINIVLIRLWSPQVIYMCFSFYDHATQFL